MTMLVISVCVTYLGLDGGLLLCKDVLHEAVDVLGQLRIFQCLGWDLEQAKILLHEDLSVGIIFHI